MVTCPTGSLAHLCTCIYLGACTVDLDQQMSAHLGLKPQCSAIKKVQFLLVHVVQSQSVYATTDCTHLDHTI